MSCIIFGDFMTDEPIEPPAPPQDPETPPSLPAAIPPEPAFLQTSLARPRVHTFFLGPQGLGSGWRFLLYVALAALVSIVAGFALRPLNQRTKGTVWAFVVGESVLLLSAFVPAWVMGRVEGRTLGDYGLPARKAFGGSFWVGA